MLNHIGHGGIYHRFPLILFPVSELVWELNVL